MIYGKLPDEAKCCGCRACANVCPVNAITMEYSKNQFIVPTINTDKCVNCGMCTKACPELNPEFVNDKEPAFYAFCADDETRAVSASGGMFSVIAEYVLSHGGCVCGAAYGENVQLRHVIIERREDLPPLRSSKYVQSDTNDVYKRIKRLLTSGRLVFFCGTPCQVAALYKVIGKHPDNLITADVICHGVPSQKFLDKYVREVSKGKKAVNVEFRNKRLGWAHKGIIVTFDDGTEYVGINWPRHKESYEEAYLKNMMMRYSCYDCQFADYPRQGDFTIGDLWHSDKLDPKSNDKKGTSFLFVNNKRAAKLFKKLKKRAVYCNEIHVDDYKKIPNRVTPQAKPSVLRRRFLDLLRYKSFSEAFRLAYNRQYDIGLVGVMGNENIGSILTYYGLYRTLAELGYSVLPIERPLDSPLPVSEKAQTFTKRWLRGYAQPVQYESIDAMRALNEKCSQFVVGSDQIYLAKMSELRGHCYFLKWVDPGKNKVGYACSFGGPGARGSKEYYRELKYYLNRFSSLTCREDDGVKFANETLKLNKQVSWVLDPVFLCKKDKFLELVNSVKVPRENPYIAAYMIIPKPELVELYQKVQTAFPDCASEIITSEEQKGRIKDAGILNDFETKDAFPVESTLETIYNSRFFVTDSYHGVCFCLIFRKDFVVMPRDFIDRFQSLLGRIGLEDRIIKPDGSNFTDALLTPIDYDSVYEKLGPEITRCRELLHAALKGKGMTDLTDMDIVMQHVKEQEETNRKLTEEVTALRKAVEALQKKLEG
ncbi:MAG: Coenzyme F420 hydrogenase/dehydrogenase, beta subunit C-terminal domain [Oscillospiraceae bacterium]|nr:Coenzyme F420 hydrogenase/dehydrogenase, beta subunit C-terminal domain [Oscillospiraceae bacterium]